MFKKLPLASAVALAIAMPAQAADFSAGPFEVSFDSTFSVGATWRTGQRDIRVLHPGNFEGGLGQSGVADDGNLNFDRGDLTSWVFRGIHDVDIRTQNAGGVFIRFNYWYDAVLEREGVAHGHTGTNYFPDVRLDPNSFDDYSKGKGINLLDAFYYTSFDLGNSPVDLRVGRQVLSWGESTFIFNGVNSINPLDVNAARRPGAEVREALLPVGMVSTSIGLSDAWSLDAFWQFEWDNTKLDGCGTFFSTVDILGGPGCNKVTLNPEVAPGRFLSDRESVEAGLYLTRTDDVEASDTGSFGVSARYYSMDLDTEFGFYYLNVHNTAPIISATDWRTNNFSNNVVSQLGPMYYAEYPEDNEIYGVSFSTTLSEWSWSGEVSYRPNQAVQINTTEILTAGLRPEVPSTFTPRLIEARPDGVAVGNRARGYEELEVWQAQMTFVNFFERLWGSDRMTFIGEVGANYVSDLPGLDEQRFGRSPVYGKCLSVADQMALGNPSPAGNMNCDGFVTSFSWGYRTRFIFNFSNAFMGWNINPTIAWNHDVKGYSPNPNFIEGRQNLGLLLDANYLSNKYRITVGYNRYQGADYDPMQDRDHISASFSMSF
ncbi:DUF1302 domain-containing protein [Aliidiomarina sanyensis]|uniref:DUF1302 domain-containing protein n=1 Tax=Aliidiomarina sanyensis TaxID=1249555 RepID=A0A432WIG7_9GAMM|nr:DUF1302 domain-containing protein [Aliidiomarina sanyensis]RUO33558.1 DUF1302 domain-containing protein [Aliidiomarina sanyensis]